MGFIGIGIFWGGTEKGSTPVIGKNYNNWSILSF